MRRVRFRVMGAAILLTLGLSAGAARVEAACGSTGVCNDVASTLWGGVTQDGFRLDWSTTSEDTSVDYYRVRRYNCSDPAQCSVMVADVNAISACSVSRAYYHVDTPPAPLSSWTYTVEVWRANGTRACAVDLETP